MANYKNAFFVLLFSFILMFPATAFSQAIPDWVRNTAYWWSQGDVSDTEYTNAMKFLIENGIIIIPNSQLGNQIVVDNGDFYVEYYPPSNPKFDEIMFWAMENEEWLVNLPGLNGIKLPYDVEIAFDQCDEANAYYDFDYHQIILCYELIDFFIDVQSEYYDSQEEITIAVQDSVYETILHELGHGLVDIYKIPITGKEEDAVDQLATLILLTEGQQGVDALYAVANWYDYSGKRYTEVEQLAFYDEHSFDMQRFYSILCLVHGSDPESYYDLVNYLPPGADVERWSNLCYWEYDKISNNWNTFLDPLWN